MRRSSVSPNFGADFWYFLKFGSRHFLTKLRPNFGTEVRSKIPPKFGRFGNVFVVER
jgi:hypothetical protein